MITYKIYGNYNHHNQYIIIGLGLMPVIRLKYNLYRNRTYKTYRFSEVYGDIR